MVPLIFFVLSYIFVLLIYQGCQKKFDEFFENGPKELSSDDQ